MVVTSRETLSPREATARHRAAPARPGTWAALATGAAGAGGLGLAVAVAFGLWLQGKHYILMFRDQAAHFDIPVHAGAFSMAGGMLLAAAAAVAAVGARLVPHEARLFLLVAGASVALALDDLFMLHERVLPDHLGIPEPVILCLLGLPLVLILALRLPRPDAGRRVALLVPYGLLGTSVALDLALPYSHFGTLIEDAFKFGGYAAWLCYWFGDVADAAAPDRAGGIE